MLTNHINAATWQLCRVWPGDCLGIPTQKMSCGCQWDYQVSWQPVQGKSHLSCPHREMQWKELQCSLLVLAKHFPMFPRPSSLLHPYVRLCWQNSISHEGTEVKRGEATWPKLWLICGRTGFLKPSLSGCRMPASSAHTNPAVLDLSGSGSWLWGMGRLACGEMVKGFGEELHWGGDGKIKWK